MAALVTISMMGESSKTNECELKHQPQQRAVFRDFLGGGAGGRDGSRNDGADPIVVVAARPSSGEVNPAATTDGLVKFSEVSPSASGSIDAASGGGRGPFSTISDLGSAERQASGQFDRIARYNSRGDFTIPDRITGIKRNISGSVYTGTSREGLHQIGPESIENSHFVKLQMLRNGIGGERSRLSHYDGPPPAVPPIRPGSVSLMLQQRPGLKTDANLCNWERSILTNMGGGNLQHAPRLVQDSLLGCAHVPLNRTRDGNPGPSTLSQIAADEGSRTGVKGAAFLNSVNASKSVQEKNPSDLIPSGYKTNPATHYSEPESSTPSIQHGAMPVSKQMTIVYGGQVHVFDDVHPNKADVIMALAGSNGGSWSINLPKSSARTNLNEHSVESDPGGSQGKIMANKGSRMSIVEQRMMAKE